jgi:hypothetical protein
VISDWAALSTAHFRLHTEYSGNSNDEMGILICEVKKKKASGITVGLFLWE